MKERMVIKRSLLPLELAKISGSITHMEEQLAKFKGLVVMLVSQRYCKAIHE